MTGLYIHVPFCAHKCDYCDFYSLPNSLELVHSFVNAVIIEASRYKRIHFDTLYLGGGTPSIIGADCLSRLVSGVKNILGIESFVEGTIEVNPDSTSPSLLEAALKNGINRISIGVQSLADDELRSVSRLHTSAQALSAINLALKAGFKRISVDVIVGLPGQTCRSLTDTLKALTAKKIEHVSIYCLSLDHETPLALNPPAGLPSDDDQADLFILARDLLKGEGFIHYEISNFSRPGCECVHNVNYWRGGEYAGLGPAAASHLNGRRFGNKADLHAYIKSPCGIVENIEQLEGEKKMAEEAILRLRLLEEGIDIDTFSSHYLPHEAASLVDRLRMLVSEDTITFDGRVYRMSPSAVLTSNSVLYRILPD